MREKESLDDDGAAQSSRQGQAIGKAESAAPSEAREWQICDL
jgi:hypothetical protein